MNATHVRSAKLDERDTTEFWIEKLRNHSLVLPEKGKTPPQSQRVHRIEMASNQHRFSRFSTNGKVKAMIIRRAKPRKHGAAVLKLFSQRPVLKQSGQIPSLPLDED